MEDKQKSLEQKKRLEQLVIHLKMNMVDLANLSGLNKNTLYHVGSGIRSEMTERTAARICYHLEKKGIHVNRDWLLDGVGEMIDEHLSVPYDQEKEKGGILMAAEDPAPYGEPDWRAKYLDLMERYIALQQEYTQLLKSRQ